MTTKHALKFNGAPHTAEGVLVNEDSSITRGVGRAKCVCGAVSPGLATGMARRDWFKGHKAGADDDEIPLDPDPALAVAAAEADPGVHAAVPDEGGAPESAGEDVDATQKDAERALPFTDAVAFHFWGYLGRDATTAFLEVAFPHITPRYDNKEHVVILQGPEDELEPAADAIMTMWSLAIAEFKEWSKGDTTWLERPRGGLEGRQASYRLRGEFYVRYATRFGEEFESGLI